MPDEDNQEPHNSRVRTAISILIPIITILVFVLFVIFDPEFRKYFTEAGYEGFYSAKEGFEMLEYLLLIFCGLAVVVFLYMFYVLKIKKIPKEKQEKFIQYVNDEKPLFIVGILILVGSILIYAPYQQYKQDQETISRLESVTSPSANKSKPAEKRPEPHKVKIIEVPVTNNIEQPAKPEESDPQKQFDVFSTSNTNQTDEIETLEAANLRKIQEAITNKNSIWKISYPLYKVGLVKLRDLLFIEATKLGDDIHQPKNYYDCLPISISPDAERMKISEISLVKNTNWDFSVFLVPAEDYKLFRVECSAGWIEIHADSHGVSRWVSFNDPALGGDNLVTTVPLDEGEDFIGETLQILVHAQKLYPIKIK